MSAAIGGSCIDLFAILMEPKIKQSAEILMRNLNSQATRHMEGLARVLKRCQFCPQCNPSLDGLQLVIPPGSGGAKAGQPFADDKLTVIQGSVTNQEDVDKVITSGFDGVVVALGGKTKDVGPTMLTGDADMSHTDQS